MLFSSTVTKDTKAINQRVDIAIAVIVIYLSLLVDIPSHSINFNLHSIIFRIGAKRFNKDLSRTFQYMLMQDTTQS